MVIFNDTQDINSVTLEEEDSEAWIKFGNMTNYGNLVVLFSQKMNVQEDLSMPDDKVLEFQLRTADQDTIGSFNNSPINN